MYVNDNDITYFDSFGVEYIPKTIKKCINRSLHNKNIKANIFRMQAYYSIMCRYFCIGFIKFMVAGETLTDFTDLFSSSDFKKLMI